MAATVNSNLPPTLPPVGTTDSGFNPEFNVAMATENGHTDGEPVSPLDGPAPVPKDQPRESYEEGPDPKTQEQVQKVLYSDIGVNTLLNRLKASIASARVCLSL